ncbi:MAG TPA: twin-arginine translocation signal domain-containing protein, partial [Thermoanaerobaculia bacterium]|nr:twin-arginine translocation signal domain-containing protein [Thermoanaerobaculia bacterium]
MELTRRGFLKATAVGSTIALGFDVARAKAEMREFKISRTTETRSICPYCAVSCGVIVHTLGDRARNVKASVVHVE